MTILLYILGALILLIGVAYLAIYIILYFPLRKKEDGFEYVHVEEDGSVRELSNDEKEYLGIDFHPFDSGRPHIKYRYNEMTPNNKIWGFIPRRRVPAHIIIKPLDSTGTDFNNMEQL